LARSGVAVGLGWFACFECFGCFGAAVGESAGRGLWGFALWDLRMWTTSIRIAGAHPTATVPGRSAAGEADPVVGSVDAGAEAARVGMVGVGADAVGVGAGADAVGVGVTGAGPGVGVDG
jgi:hypothetical protein